LKAGIGAFDPAGKIPAPLKSARVAETQARSQNLNQSRGLQGDDEINFKRMAAFLAGEQVGDYLEG